MWAAGVSDGSSCLRRSAQPHQPLAPEGGAMHFALGALKPTGVGFAALVAAVATVAGGAASPGLGAPPACPSSTDDAYRLAVGALTGPAATDVSLDLAAAAGCAAVTEVKHVQIKTFDEDGKLVGVANHDDVAAENGRAVIRHDRVAAHRAIEAEVLVQTGTPPRTYVLRGETTSLLRPHLVVAELDAAHPHTLATRPIAVGAELKELNGDTDAVARVQLLGPLGPLGEAVDVTVEAGDEAYVSFPAVALTEAVPTELKLQVQTVTPGDYGTAVDDPTTVVDVTKNEVVDPFRTLVPSLGGYGFQFNHHLYAPITSPPPETLPDLESKVEALEPQFVRVFFNDNWALNADGKHAEWPENLASYRQTLQLANEIGATIVVTYQTVANARTNPALWMTRFADELQYDIRTLGVSNLRWVNVGNEPNSGTIPLTTYEALYRQLDAQLAVRGIRGQIGLVGGDLVESSTVSGSDHRKWFDYMVTHMNDVIDAWSEHIYWNYWDHPRMEERVKDVAYLVHRELAEAARKPTFVLEYGVRGYDACGTSPTLKAAYYKKGADCLDLRRLTIAAFQRLEFAVNSAQHGFDAAVNWDLYWSTYDLTKNNQSYWAIGPPDEGWALYPTYYASQLLFQTTAPGWRVVALDPWVADDEEEPIARQQNDANPPWLWDAREQEVIGYAGPDGQLTVVGLDTNGRNLIEPNGESSAYSVAGLPPGTRFTLALWNADGDGKNSVAGTVTTNAAGVARFEVPLQAAFFLTNVPVS
jgi:hypothetical protein